MLGQTQVQLAQATHSKMGTEHELQMGSLSPSRVWKSLTVSLADSTVVSRWALSLSLCVLFSVRNHNWAEPLEPQPDAGGCRCGCGFGSALEDSDGMAGVVPLRRCLLHLSSFQCNAALAFSHFTCRLKRLFSSPPAKWMATQMREPGSQPGSHPGRHHPPAAGRPHGWSGYMQAPKWKSDLCENVSFPFQVRTELWYSFIRLVGFLSPIELQR